MSREREHNGLPRKPMDFVVEKYSKKLCCEGSRRLRRAGMEPEAPEANKWMVEERTVYLEKEKCTSIIEPAPLSNRSNPDACRFRQRCKRISLRRLAVSTSGKRAIGRNTRDHPAGAADDGLAPHHRLCGLRLGS